MLFYDNDYVTIVVYMYISFPGQAPTVHTIWIITMIYDNVHQCQISCLTILKQDASCSNHAALFSNTLKNFSSKSFWHRFPYQWRACKCVHNLVLQIILRSVKYYICSEFKSIRSHINCSIPCICVYGLQYLACIWCMCVGVCLYVGKCIFTYFYVLCCCIIHLYFILA